LNEQEQAYIVDALVNESEDINVLAPIFSIISHKGYSKDKALVVLERILRKATMLFDFDQKNQFLRTVPIDLLASSDIGLRTPFFIDLIDILERVQFKEVNKITASIVRVQEAIPDGLTKRYVLALLSLAKSSAWEATPTAKSALLRLPDNIVTLSFDDFTNDYLFWNRDDYFRAFLRQYERIWPENRKKVYGDFLLLDEDVFFEKYPHKYS
jgi:hypothetical protein